MRVVPALMKAGRHCTTTVKEILRSGDDRQRRFQPVAGLTADACVRPVRRVPPWPTRGWRGGFARRAGPPPPRDSATPPRPPGTVGRRPRHRSVRIPARVVPPRYAARDGNWLPRASSGMGQRSQPTRSPSNVSQWAIAGVEGGLGPRHQRHVRVVHCFRWLRHRRFSRWCPGKSVRGRALSPGVPLIVLRCRFKLRYDVLAGQVARNRHCTLRWASLPSRGILVIL